MRYKKMTPVLKWAGGKTQLLDSIHSRIPVKYNKYYEPFIGGGAVLFSITPKQAIINDTNEQLINLYQQLKVSPQSVIDVVKKLDSVSCNKDFYLAMREKYNKKIVQHELDFECAGLMIWVNKHCFNGLYRVNGNGLFNVPYNNKVNGKSIDEKNVMAIGKYFQKADITILCQDFEEVCDKVKAGDFVYFDSPYVPVSETSYFTDYTKKGFSLEDHKRLAELFKRLDKKGALLMLSNNDVELVHELYKEFHTQCICVKRLINQNAEKRTGREVLITNY